MFFLVVGNSSTSRRMITYLIISIDLYNTFILVCDYQSFLHQPTGLTNWFCNRNGCFGQQGVGEDGNESGDILHDHHFHRRVRRHHHRPGHPPGERIEGRVWEAAEDRASQPRRRLLRSDQVAKGRSVALDKVSFRVSIRADFITDAMVISSHLISFLSQFSFQKYVSPEPGSSLYTTGEFHKDRPIHSCKVPIQL